MLIKTLKKMHPVEIIKWFGTSIKNLPRNTKNLFVKIYKNIKKPRKKSKENST
jgi:hypothetical protein